MQRYIVTSAAYGAAGLAAGLYYRTLTHSRHFEGQTQLALAHTHLLALGMLVFLSLAGIDSTLHVSRRPLARIAEGIYHAGMVLSVGAMLVFGTLQVLGIGFVEPARNGIAGLGHVLLTVAFGLLFATLLRRPVATEVAR